jgi:hypothetical protein
MGRKRKTPSLELLTIVYSGSIERNHNELQKELTRNIIRILSNNTYEIFDMTRPHVNYFANTKNFQYTITFRVRHPKIKEILNELKKLEKMYELHLDFTHKKLK